MIGEEVFSTTSFPTGRFPEDGKSCLRKAHPLLTSFLTFFPKVSVTRHFWGVLDLSGVTALVSVTPSEQRAVALTAPLPERCSSPQTFSQTSGACKTLALQGGDFPAVERAFGFLNIGVCR